MELCHAAAKKLPKRDPKQVLVGKTIASITDAPDRMGHHDDFGFVIEFTDGTKLTLSAGMGQGCGYIVEDIR